MTPLRVCLYVVALSWMIVDISKVEGAAGYRLAALSTPLTAEIPPALNGVRWPKTLRRHLG